MAAGQQSGGGAMTNMDDEKVRKDDILSNRDKTQRRPGESLDGKGVQVEEYKDIPTNQRPKKDAGPEAYEPEASKTKDKVDRPGFDLGGTNDNTSAGKGLGLGQAAKEGRKGWGLPRQPK